MKINKILLILLLLPASLLAEDYQGIIYTWGYGDLIKNALEAIKIKV